MRNFFGDLFRLAVSSCLKVYENGPRKLLLFFRTCFNFTCLQVHEIPRRPVILAFSLKFPYGRESAADLVVSMSFSILPIQPLYTPIVYPTLYPRSNPKSYIPRLAVFVSYHHCGSAWHGIFVRPSDVGLGSGRLPGLGLKG